jgi:hypothetical protein
VLLNLASNEYFSAVKRSALKARVINVDFKDLKNGQYKIISFYAKKARGMMSRFVIEQRINDPEQLKQFDVQGYYYSAEQSKPDIWCSCAITPKTESRQARRTTRGSRLARIALQPCMGHALIRHFSGAKNHHSYLYRKTP